MRNLKEAKGERTRQYPVLRIQGWAHEELLWNVISPLCPVSGSVPFLVNIYDIRHIKHEFKIKWKKEKEPWKMTNLE